MATSPIQNEKQVLIMLTNEVKLFYLTPKGHAIAIRGFKIKVAHKSIHTMHLQYSEETLGQN